MTTPPVPTDAAIEAAAEALWLRPNPRDVPWSQLDHDVRVLYRDEATAALTAAHALDVPTTGVPSNVTDVDESTMVLNGDDWLAVVLIDNDGVAHLRDSGAISPVVIASSLRECARKIAP